VPPYVPYAFTGSAALFDQAKYALQTIERKRVPERQRDQREALIAVVFSAMTLEAFINEFGDLAAADWASAPGDPQSIKEMGVALKGLEERQASIQRKYRKAKRILTGQHYDQSGQPYQDFKMLIDLRNALVHIKGLGLYGVSSTGTDSLTQSPDVIAQLRGDVLADVSGMDPPAFWIEKLQCLASARWACTTAADMIDSIIAAMPESRFRVFWRDHQRYYDISVPPVSREVFT
jgi:hypothetical protein